MRDSGRLKQCARTLGLPRGISGGVWRWPCSVHLGFSFPHFGLVFGGFGAPHDSSARRSRQANTGETRRAASLVAARRDDLPATHLPAAGRTAVAALAQVPRPWKWVPSAGCAVVAPIKNRGRSDRSQSRGS
jgi:hypothetical protein